MNAAQREGFPSEATTAAPASETSIATYERRTSVAVLCLELAHEIAPTLAFLRDLLRSDALTGMDRSIAEEEVGRLQELLASLRRTKRGEGEFAPVLLAPVVVRAAARAGDDVKGAARLAVDVPGDARVTANERAVEIMITALLRNALAASAVTKVQVRAEHGPEGWTLLIEDDGEGFGDGIEERLFLPLATLGAGGCGTGMALALRLARDHGWELEHTRRDGRTTVVLQLGAGS